MRLPGFGLSEWGRGQAEKLRDFFDDKKIDKIYSSPLDRTKETAKIIASDKTRIEYSNNFIEANFKKWEGVKRSERAKSEVEGYYRDPVKYSAILGESLSYIQKRVLEKLFVVIEKNKGKNIIIVTHASPLIVAMLYFMKRPLSDFSKITVNYAGVATITFDDELECKGVVYNEYVKQRAKNER
jgi:probable phosphoglycerate mutase